MGVLPEEAGDAVRDASHTARRPEVAPGAGRVETRRNTDTTLGLGEPVTFPKRSRRSYPIVRKSTQVNSEMLLLRKGPAYRCFLPGGPRAQEGPPPKAPCAQLTSRSGRTATRR